MNVAVRVWLIVGITLSLCASVTAQGVPAGDAALAVPVSGQVAIVNEGRSSTESVPFPYVSGASTRQHYDVDITLPVLGLPLRGHASVQMDTRVITFVIVSDVHAIGGAQNVALHGPAGDTAVSVKVDQPMHGPGSYDPAEAAIHLRGTGGTGMFTGINLAGDLKGVFRPTGTLYLTYPSNDAALDAVRRGLAQNDALSDAQRMEALEQARQALAQAAPATFPPDNATQAIVTTTIRQTGAQVQVALRIVVPSGDAHQAVKVVAVGPSGPAKTAYQGVNAPGETVSASVTGTAPLIVQVYVAGALVKQITVPAE